MGEVRRFGRLGQGATPRVRGLPPRIDRSGRVPAKRARARPDFLLTIGIVAGAFVVTAFVASLLLEDGHPAVSALSPSWGGGTGEAGGWGDGADPEQARFTLCVAGRGTNCVIDGDTLRYGGEIVRIADIDTPEVRNYGCAEEKVRGDAATARLLALINAGPFTLAPYERDRDQYGRALRIVTRDGQSLGMTLVAEGLAREWDGARRGWC